MTVGKFEACANQELAEKLYDITLDGGCDAELGDVQDFGWYGLIIEDDKAYIVNENNDGFFTYTEYTSMLAARKAWLNIEADYNDFNESIEA
jgi:hypothetical protein